MDTLQKKVVAKSESKLKELSSSTGITNDILKKMFEDIGESPEKLRALLNLWFVPQRKPEFVDDRTHKVAGPGDIEFLGQARPAQTPTPRRMFDIDTGNLVDNWPAIGATGQYCMLSHRWKGEEIKLGDIAEARRKDLERTKEGITPNGGSDLEILQRQCKLDIEDQEKIIQDLYNIPVVSNDVVKPSAPFNLGDLLKRRLDSKSAEYALGKAKANEDQTRTRVKFAQMERIMFRDLVKQISQNIQGGQQGSQQTSTNAHSDHSVADSVVSSVVDEAGKKAEKAKEELDAAKENFSNVQKDLKYFHDRPRLRDALEEMVIRLQRWKSAIKIQNSVQHAMDIFNNKLFQRRERRYLWTDTCCIDKPNFGELSESLSLMGDWYADADFTLVQLDTPYSEADALKDWARFDAERGKGAWEEPAANIESFDKINKTKLEWSERAWTLQELVMSKTTFYVNSAWIPLSRPIESLGYFYYLIPFIELYTRGDTQNMYLTASTPRCLRGYWKEKNFGLLLQRHSISSELDDFKLSFQKPIEGCDTAAVADAQEMIALLHQLGFRIPQDMSIESATSEIAQAVYIAAADTCKTNSGREELLADLIDTLDQQSSDERANSVKDCVEEQEEKAQDVINFILQCLVAETKDLVLGDRKHIANFGNIQQLEAWQSGTARRGFSAQSVLEVSGKRYATVETDRAYALMGTLGVRFNTFSAEGYPRALSRLLDEVIINFNDVSVFNWTGMDMGSPIRGRSMYPAAHTAYGNQEDRGRRYNLLLSAEVQEKMEEVMNTYHAVINVLDNVIELIKEKKHKNLPLSWIAGIIELLRDSTFQSLEPELHSVGKIVRFIMNYCLEEPAAAPAKADATAATPQEKTSSLASLSSLSRTSTVTSLTGSLTSLPNPSLSSVTSWGSTSTKQEPETSGTPTSSKRSSRFGLSKGLGIKTPSFGMGKKSPDPVAQQASPPATPPPPSAQSPTPTESAFPLSPPPAPEVRKPTWEDVDTAVQEYLGSFKQETPINPPTLPQQIQDLTPIDRPDTKPHASLNSAISHDAVVSSSDQDFISPNPIIVNNSGIESLFDIQRVIVTMIDPEKLRRQISKSVSPKQKISGWCSISTGFARVVTSFCCETRILEKQLDVIQTVEATVLREQAEERSHKLIRAMKIGKRGNEQAPKDKSGQGTNDKGTATGDDNNNSNNTSDKAAEGDSTPPAADTTTTAPAANGTSEVTKPADEGSGEKNEEGGAGETKQAENKADVEDTTGAELLVHRMITFIQESSLPLVAGEWVLARISSTPGANWFLCHLELGATPSTFYGHRIATGAIDFKSSTPEPGLVSAWQVYMDRKKKKMCHLLGAYLKSRQSRKDGEEKRKVGTAIAMQGYVGAMKSVEELGLASPGFVPRFGILGGGKDDGVEEKGGERRSEEKQNDDDDDDDSDDEEELLHKILSGTKIAALAFTDYTYHAAKEMFYDLRAGRLDKTLSAKVLKRTPKALRSAVENMSESTNLMPAMFHSSTRVHMF